MYMYVHKPGTAQLTCVDLLSNASISHYLEYENNFSGYNSPQLSFLAKKVYVSIKLTYIFIQSCT